MIKYRVWAKQRDCYCLLLAANEKEAFEIIADMKIFDYSPLTAYDAEPGDQEVTYGHVVLPNGETVPIPD